MMQNKIPTLLFVFLLLTNFTQAQNAKTVFKSGEDGYQSYRIPALVALPNGDLLAFCEGRVHNAADFGDIDLVMKRSSDGGKNWSDLQVLIDNDKLQVGNSAPVVDLTDPKYPNGRIFLFFNTGNNHEYEVRMKKGYREVWYITSIDQGKTWSEAVNITTQVHKPQIPEINPAYNFDEDWRTFANTPGHAIQIQSGPYKGRIYVPANHSSGFPKDDFRDYKAHAYYSDDHGKTFQLSQTVDFEGSNESTAVELSDGKLMLNSRNQRGDVKARIVSISPDGGHTWEKTEIDTRLIDPVNQGSLLLLGKKKGKHIIAFSNAADENQRNRLSIKISFDEGKSWAKTILVDEIPDPKVAYTAYSDMVVLSKNKIGILYERNDYQEIVFKEIQWK